MIIKWNEMKKMNNNVNEIMMKTMKWNNESNEKWKKIMK